MYTSGNEPITQSDVKEREISQCPGDRCHFNPFTFSVQRSDLPPLKYINISS